MCLGFSLSVLVLSLLTLVQHANAIGDRRGGSSGYTRNSKLAFPSAFESSAQDGGFLGSSRSSHSAGGQVDRYSPEGSVSSYGSSSMDVRKPTQNSQQPRQTNPKAKGVIQSKAGMWDFVSPKNEKRFESGIASSREIVIKAGPPPPSEPQPSVYQPSVNSMKPRQAGYQSPSGYPPKPQHAGYQSQAIYPPKHQQAGYQSSSGYPPSSVYPSKTQQASYQSSSVYPPKPQQAGYQSQSIYPLKPQQAGYQPKPQPQIRKPTLNSKQAHQTNPDEEGVIQTKAGMWDFVSPNNEKRIESGISSSRGIIVPSSPQPSGYRSPSVFQPKPHQPWSPSKHKQVGIQIKPASWQLSPIGGVSSTDVQSGNLKVQVTPARTRQIPVSSQHHPRWQRSMIPVLTGKH